MMPSTPGIPPPQSRRHWGLPWPETCRRATTRSIAVIGDGSMTGGMAYEGLNHAGHLNRDLVVILNDNEMSIAENVGALSNFLSRTITSEFVHKIKKELEGFLEGLDGVGKHVLKIARRPRSRSRGSLRPACCSRLSVSNIWVQLMVTISSC